MGDAKSFKKNILCTMFKSCFLFPSLSSVTLMVASPSTKMVVLFILNSYVSFDCCWAGLGWASEEWNGKGGKRMKLFLPIADL